MKNYLFSKERQRGRDARRKTSGLFFIQYVNIEKTTKTMRHEYHTHQCILRHHFATTNEIFLVKNIQKRFFFYLQNKA